MTSPALFPVPMCPQNPGEIHKGVRKTVELIQKTPALADALAGQCALALQLAVEADNVDASERAYARVKLYDSLAGVLAKLQDALAGAGTMKDTGALADTLRVIEGLGGEDQDAAL